MVMGYEWNAFGHLFRISGTIEMCGIRMLYVFFLIESVHFLLATVFIYLFKY